MNTSVRIGNLTLKNPVTVASGTAGYGEELANFFDLSKIGAIFTKGLSLKPRPGNKGNRILETPSGILNSIGLENVGIDKFIEEKLPFLLKKGATAIPNIAGHSIEENVEMCKIFSEIPEIKAIELNVSCPNVKEGGIAFGQDTSVLKKLIESIKKVTSDTLIVKLSPNVTNITDFAITAQQAGADAISAINTLLGMKIDIHKRKPHFNNKVAGLSGPAIKPAALRMVYSIFEKVEIPIVGLGGISTTEDALEFIFAGATAISLGTINMVYPDRAAQITTELESFLEKENEKDINNLIGCAH
jgi:dihydroorotate dehydrogenase (NAD+) catalytic subunit